MTNEKGYFVASPWTWRERLWFRLFPSTPCSLPKAPNDWLDCLFITTVVHLSVMDRFRVLVSGQVKVETRTITENLVGGAMTASVAFPVWLKNVKIEPESRPRSTDDR